MTIFDLLFLVVALATAVLLLLAVYSACRRRYARGARVLTILACQVSAYASLLLFVSLTSRPTIVPRGQKQCFDDWCVSVESVTRRAQIGNAEITAHAQGIFYLVAVKASNVGRGRAQAAADAEVWLIDAAGRRYAPSPEGQAALDAAGTNGPALTSRIAAGESIERVFVFDVAKDAEGLGLITSHGRIPGILIVADPASFLHAPTIHQLDTFDDA